MPPVDRIVVNEELQSAAGEQCFALWLPHQGRYYAEIVRANPSDSAASVELEMKVNADKKSYFTKRVAQHLDAAQTGATLLWFNSPYDLPARRELSMCVRVRNDSTSPIRLQISRKLELLPFVR